MSEQTLKQYEHAIHVRQQAEKWNDLPNGKRYEGSKFSISIAHCNPPMLCRAGQEVCGGRNYWETEKEFNKAILEHLVDNWDKIYPDVLVRLKGKENTALKNCQSFLDKMQKAIDAVESV